MSDFTLNTKGLDKFLETFKGELPTIHVGVLADKTSRKGDGGTNNAEVGAAHEFGTSTLPRRSFLRFPLFLFLARRVDERGLTSKGEFERMMKVPYGLAVWMKKIGALSENIIQEAFASGGFGAWKASDMTKKKVKQTLIETQQLRNSITSELR